MRSRHRLVVLFVSSLAIVALALFGLLLWLDPHWGVPPGNRVAFVIFAILLFLGETQPRLWMRFGDGGEVTPGWAFAFALALLGHLPGAVIIMVLSNLFVDMRYSKEGLKVAFNVAQVGISLTIGCLLLYAFGIRSGIGGLDHLPLKAALGILLGGIATFLVNGTLTATVIAVSSGIGPIRLMRAQFALSMAVDGALLALAPVFVIAVQFSMLMLPLMLITSYLVFNSARAALRREHEANHDPLTTLLNRRAFDERLAASLSESGPNAHSVVLVMDLDRFKDINDRLGHLTGDRLLQSFADRLQRLLPTSASAARLGGDEFAVTLTGVASEEEARRVVRELHAELSRPHDLSGFPLTAAVSVGTALAPLHGSTPSALVASADLAMYRAKQNGSGIEFASPDDRVHDVGRVSLLADLREALGTSQLSAHYQPLVNVRDGGIESVEALLRWQHPVHGNIPPGEFIAMTEQTDLIGPLTESMLRMALTDMLTLGPDMPRVAVNIAARSLLDRQFASRILAITRELNFPTSQLEIEVTERDIAAGSDRSSMAIATLRAAGVRVAIDDFGTGYSSFLTLRELDADRLKIDQQFTRNIATSPADEVIVRKVIDIAHELGLDVVAEGVESSAVWAHLANLECDVAQGYAIASPMPLPALVKWLAAERSLRARRERMMAVAS